MKFFSFKNLFSRKPGWKGSPEMFLAMVMEMQSMNNKEPSLEETLQIGEIMQKVVNVNLYPYQNFADLLERGKPDFTIMEPIRKEMKEHHERVELKKAIYGNEADLGDDDVMKSDSEGAKFARKFVEDLGEYVEFKKEDHEEQS